MSPNKINLAEKLELINEYWKPAIAGQLNGQDVRLVKLKGEFIWHKHDQEDEMFLVIKGMLTMEFRDRTTIISPGEFIIIPRGTEHKPVAAEEVHVMLFEPSGTLNTGDQQHIYTRNTLEVI